MSILITFYQKANEKKNLQANQQKVGIYQITFYVVPIDQSTLYINYKLWPPSLPTNSY